jgi:hypothetical protein
MIRCPQCTKAALNRCEYETDDIVYVCEKCNTRWRSEGLGFTPNIYPDALYELFNAIKLKQTEKYSILIEEIDKSFD